MLFVDPQTSASYFGYQAPNLKRDFRFFFRDVLGSFITPLGIRRWFGIFFQGSARSSESRILGTAKSGLSPLFARSALQQAYEAHSHSSASYHALEHSEHSFPAKRPSILISSSDRMHHSSRWSTGQKALAEDTLRGLLRWDQVRGGHDVCSSSDEGRKVCEHALKSLIAL